MSATSILLHGAMPPLVGDELPPPISANCRRFDRFVTVTLDIGDVCVDIFLPGLDAAASLAGVVTKAVADARERKS